MPTAVAPSTAPAWPAKCNLESDTLSAIYPLALPTPDVAVASAAPKSWKCLVDLRLASQRSAAWRRAVKRGRPPAWQRSSSQRGTAGRTRWIRRASEMKPPLRAQLSLAECFNRKTRVGNGLSSVSPLRLCVYVSGLSCYHMITRSYACSVSQLSYSVAELALVAVEADGPHRRSYALSSLWVAARAGARGLIGPLHCSVLSRIDDDLRSRI